MSCDFSSITFMVVGNVICMCVYSSAFEFNPKIKTSFGLLAFYDSLRTFLPSSTVASGYAGIGGLSYFWVCLLHSSISMLANIDTNIATKLPMAIKFFVFSHINTFRQATHHICYDDVRHSSRYSYVFQNQTRFLS